ncbi:MAG: hypothetical protein HKN23_17315 [Verrucomicrobiales bacterium]|nr:hypothetical protein [Verrucomicrobiales bacterium]
MAPRSSSSSSSLGANSFTFALLSAVLAAISIFTEWGRVSLQRATSGDGSIFDIAERALGNLATAGRVYGSEGSVALGKLEIPMWLPSVLTIAGAVFLALRIPVPKVLSLILIAIGGVFALWMMIFVLDDGIGIGSILLAIGAALGMVAGRKTA